ncbi:MAG: hypothetical protein NW207_04015 [Cytophagales bacterium]|nr:hypothetical protein [Cytophagales bacterium]
MNVHDTTYILTNDNKLAIFPISSETIGYEILSQNLLMYMTTYRNNNCKAVIVHEHIWSTKNGIIKSILLGYFKKNKIIYARKTNIMDIAQTTYDDFLEQHHLLGTTRSRYKYGLYHLGKLVAVAGFGKPLYMKYEAIPYLSTELIRFVNKSGISVAGALSKFIHHFTSQVHTDEIMTYVDLEWSNGESYCKIGFEITSATPPIKIRDTSNVKQHNDGKTTMQGRPNMGNLKLVKKIF